MRSGMVRLGSRGSLLALWQANHVKDVLTGQFPGLTVDIRVFTTKGDRILDSPLSRIGGKGLFVRELEEALVRGEIDGAVHSLKDMPVDQPEPLGIVACMPREDARDALISKSGLPLNALGQGAIIGTSSLRRRSQLLAARPDLTIVDLRGNLDTRLRKLSTEGLDAIVVAAAGLKRLGRSDAVTEYLELPLFIPAVCQGIIGIESNAERKDVHALLSTIDDPLSRVAAEAERSFLREVMGGCQVPVAAHANVERDLLRMIGMIGSLDGSECFREQMTSPLADASACGRAVARQCLAAGGRVILERLLSQVDTGFES